MSIIPRIVLIALLIWAIQVTTSYCTTLVVYLRPINQTQSVILIGAENDYDLVKMEEKYNESIYNLDLSTLPNTEIFSEYDLVVKDITTGQDIIDLHIQFPLRLDIERIKIWIIDTQPEPSRQLIKEFSKRGLERDKAYQTYYEARRIYKIMRVDTAQHYLLGGAAYWYFTAAYELAKPQLSVIPMDQNSIKAVEEIIDRAKNDERLASALKNDLQIDLSSLNAMIDKAKRLKWKTYRSVEEASNNGDYNNALTILGYYEDTYESLSDEERKKVLKEYGVNDSRIKNDKAYLKTLVSETQQ